MLFEHPEMRKILGRIVTRLARDSLSLFEEDLLQETIIHLWRTEQEHPNQSWSWYVENCRFDLQNRLRHGTSIDSLKRNGCRVAIGGDSPENAPAEQDSDDPFEPADANGNVGEDVSARDLESVLAGRLSTVEVLILTRLAAGFSVREVGKQLRISHTAVAKHRHKIALLATALGIFS